MPDNTRHFKVRNASDWHDAIDASAAAHKDAQAHDREIRRAQAATQPSRTFKMSQGDAAWAELMECDRQTREDQKAAAADRGAMQTDHVFDMSKGDAAWTEFVNHEKQARADHEASEREVAKRYYARGRP